MLVIPVITLIGGLRSIAVDCKQHVVKQQVGLLPDSKDRVPLYSRFLGYTSAAVFRYWEALDEEGRRCMQCFLLADRMFAIRYSLAFAISIVVGAFFLKNLTLSILALCPLLMFAADWTENTTLLGQLKHYVPGNEQSLDQGRIRIASLATIAKFVMFALTAGSILWLVVLVLRMEWV